MSLGIPSRHPEQNCYSRSEVAEEVAYVQFRNELVLMRDCLDSYKATFC